MPAEPEGSSFELIQRAQAGDPAAMDELLQRHLPALRAFVRARSDRMLRARESQSDLVQSVCREALGGILDYEWRGEASFRSWLFAVALHRLQDKRDYHGAARRDPAREFRQDATGVESLADVYRGIGGPSQHAIAGELVERFERALDRLPEDYRQLIALSKLIGLSNAEIAEQLGTSEAAVRAKLIRALARLAGVMQHLDG